MPGIITRGFTKGTIITQGYGSLAQIISATTAIFQQVAGGASLRRKKKELERQLTVSAKVRLVNKEEPEVAIEGEKHNLMTQKDITVSISNMQVETIRRFLENISIIAEIIKKKN